MRIECCRPCADRSTPLGLDAPPARQAPQPPIVQRAMSVHRREAVIRWTACCGGYRRRGEWGCGSCCELLHRTLGLTVEVYREGKHETIWHCNRSENKEMTIDSSVDSE